MRLNINDMILVTGQKIIFHLDEFPTYPGSISDRFCLGSNGSIHFDSLQNSYTMMQQQPRP
jgi:hypothetical protein